MLSIEKYIERLKELEYKTANDSLSPNKDQQTEWQFGYVCGIKAGLKLALETLTSEPGNDQEGESGKDHFTRRR